MKWNMRSITKELLLGAVVLFIFSNIISYLRSPELPSAQLPQIQTKLLDGSDYTLKKGEPAVLHFWATWCPTCKLEAPNIERVSQDYEVVTIAVNSGENAKVQAYMKERGLSFKVINDTAGKWAEQFHVEAYPTTFIYDAKGKLKFTEVGYTSTAGLLARLKMSE